MSQINSLSSFQYDDTDLAMGRYPDFVPVPPPITTSSSGSLLEQSLPGPNGHLAATQMRSLMTTDQRLPASGPLHDVSTTQSLIAALQSTMTPAGRSPVVIPGSRKRKRTKTTEELRPGRRISPHLRLGITVGAIIAVMITTLASLTPLGSGQNSGTLFGGTLQLVQAEQQNRDIAGHTFVTLAQANPAPANTGTTNQQPAPPPIALSTSGYVAIARQDAIANGISPDYFVRQIQVESGFNANAYSPAGAVGIAQFLPSTAAGLGVNPYDPISALAGAARYMAGFARQYNGNYAMALAAYNAGGGTVQYAVAAGGANWMNFLPYETRQYILKIMGI
ncbi:MAG: lytic transglycosylase domain-containing protein [Ktedonobacteraceae bacterium]|nr:lytic transglycosylase domain-containing protein [Ktedonobacteraceae bacterium]